MAARVKTTKKDSDFVGLRLSEEFRSRIDRYLEKVQAANPGFDLTRSDAIRQLIARGLEAAEGGTTR